MEFSKLSKEITNSAHDFPLQIHFCSAECRELCYEGFHWAECAGGRLASLQADPEVGRLAVLALRIVVGAGFDKCVDTGKSKNEN